MVGNLCCRVRQVSVRFGSKGFTWKDKDVILAARRKMIIYIKYIRQERVASFLSGRMEAEKVTGSDGGNSNHRSSRRRQDPNHYSATHNNINGVY